MAISKNVKATRTTKAAVKPAVKTTAKKGTAVTTKKSAAKATLSKTVRVGRSTPKPAPKKAVAKKTRVAKQVAKTVRDWEQTAVAKQLIGELVINHMREAGQLVCTHKDQPPVAKMVNKDLWIANREGKLVKYGQIKHAIATISTWPEFVNYLEVFCSDMYFAAHKIRKVGTKFVYDRNIELPSAREAVLIDVDSINGKPKRTKTEKVTVKVSAKPKKEIKVTKPAAKAGKVTSAKDAKPDFSTVLADKGASVVKIGALRNDVRAAGVKVSADNGVFTLTRDRQVIGVVTLEVTATGRKLTAQKANAKDRLVNYRHVYGTTKTFKNMVTGIDCTQANMIKHIIAVINDDVAELAVDLCA